LISKNDEAVRNALRFPYDAINFIPNRYRLYILRILLESSQNWMTYIPVENGVTSRRRSSRLRNDDVKSPKDGGDSSSLKEKVNTSQRKLCVTVKGRVVGSDELGNNISKSYVGMKKVSKSANNRKDHSTTGRDELGKMKSNSDISKKFKNRRVRRHPSRYSTIGAEASREVEKQFIQICVLETSDNETVQKTETVQEITENESSCPTYEQFEKK